MKRRIFIRIASLSSIGVFLPLSYCKSVRKDITEILAEPETLSDIFEKDLIRDFGKKYIKNFSKIKQKDELLNEMIRTTGSVDSSQESLRKKLMAKIKSDFETQKIHSIDGWFFSETELRQCALSYLFNT